MDLYEEAMNEAHSSASSARVSPLRVLVVDDTLANRMMFSVLLKKLGHSVIEAENGQEALEKYKNYRPDLVLMDLMMPVMDGYEAITQIRLLPSDRWVPIIILSALTEQKDMLRGFEVGADDYMPKPIQMEVLAAKLRSVNMSLTLQNRVIDGLRRTHAITNTVIDSIITIDERGTIQTANESTLWLFGYQEEELVGKNVKVLMPEPYHSQHDHYISRYKEEGDPRVIGQRRELTGKRKDGSTFPIDLAVTEVLLESGRMFVGVVRDITERKQIEAERQAQTEVLQDYHDTAEAENQLACKVVERQMLRPSLSDPSVHCMVRPATNFSGDLVACSRCPDGRLYAMLSDATGHGLPAAMTVLPVVSLFYSLVRRGRELSEIVADINLQLCASMPPGRFVAVSFVMLDDAKQTGEVWNGGMPEMLLVNADGSIGHRFKSTHVPLGITEWDDSEDTPEAFDWQNDCQIVMYSDGLVEATNAAGDMFGDERLAQALASKPGPDRFQAITEAMDTHLSGTPAHDDVSLIVLDCHAGR